MLGVVTHTKNTYLYTLIECGVWHNPPCPPSRHYDAYVSIDASIDANINQSTRCPCTYHINIHLICVVCVRKGVILTRAICLTRGRPSQSQSRLLRDNGQRHFTVQTLSHRSEPPENPAPVAFSTMYELGSYNIHIFIFWLCANSYIYIYIKQMQTCCVPPVCVCCACHQYQTTHSRPRAKSLRRRSRCCRCCCCVVFLVASVTGNVTGCVNMYMLSLPCRRSHINLTNM